MTLTIQILDISNEEMINRYTGVYFLLQLVDKTISSKLVVEDILKKNKKKPNNFKKWSKISTLFKLSSEIPLYSMDGKH